MAAVEPTISTGETHLGSLCMDQASIPTHEVTSLSDISKHLRANLVDCWVLMLSSHTSNTELKSRTKNSHQLILLKLKQGSCCHFKLPHTQDVHSPLTAPCTITQTQDQAVCHHCTSFSPSRHNSLTQAPDAFCSILNMWESLRDCKERRNSYFKYGK